MIIHKTTHKYSVPMDKHIHTQTPTHTYTSVYSKYDTLIFLSPFICILTFLEVSIYYT